MSSSFETEAIIIHSLPFKERDRILTLFTPDHGIIKCFCYGSKSAFCSPLNRVQLLLRTKNSDLFFCQELSITGHFLALRENLEALEGAGEMIRTLLETQKGSKPCEELYLLFSAYLTALTEISAATLSSSFRLKALHHEGLLGDLKQCSSCGKALEELFLDRGEAFCQQHRDKEREAEHFDADETKTLLKALYGRFLSEMKQLSVSAALEKKIKKSFENIILLQDSVRNW